MHFASPCGASRTASLLVSAVVGWQTANPGASAGHTDAVDHVFRPTRLHEIGMNRPGPLHVVEPVQSLDLLQAGRVPVDVQAVLR
jgi:hypothetical protein